MITLILRDIYVQSYIFFYPYRHRSCPAFFAGAGFHRAGFPAADSSGSPRAGYPRAGSPRPPVAGSRRAGSF